ncbi:hypothetical protein CIG19_15820 [Enterobacterales bacterium CwR94]|nr:hypothetical protein CIG19_15820 [Enterobacterales bacterium CwR94]
MHFDFMRIATTPDVENVQSEMGSHRLRRFAPENRTPPALSRAEKDFISSRDSFYLATCGSQGWPYLQHRGGPAGFLHVLDERTLAFADVRGNRQYVTTGNLRGNRRACLFLMDYPRRARLKIYAELTEFPLSDPLLAERLCEPAFPGHVERYFRLQLHAWDWNCPQYITPRYTQSEIDTALEPVMAQLQQLENENQQLRQQLAQQEKKHE